MSSNIYKSSWVVVETEDKCVIDSNSRIARRMEEVEAEMRRKASGSDEESGEEGFMGGLNAEKLDAEDFGGEEGNVLKAADESESKSEGPSLEEIQAQIDAQLEAARQEAAVIKQLARDEIENERKKAMEIGRQSGYDMGMQMAQAEADKMQAEFAKMQDELKAERARLEAEYDQLVDELEPRFIDTITAIYKHIFQIELENDKNILVHLIESTMRQIESSRTFIVHVSQEDFPFVNMHKKQITEAGVSGNGTVDVVEDITLHKNECMIETDNGIFDCGVGTQLEELTKMLRLLSFQKD